MLTTTRVYYFPFEEAKNVRGEKGVKSKFYSNFFQQPTATTTTKPFVPSIWGRLHEPKENYAGSGT